ncbi:MAG: hypothetical protein AAB611_02920 [Patescibacteria group bacterium]
MLVGLWAFLETVVTMLVLYDILTALDGERSIVAIGVWWNV